MKKSIYKILLLIISLFLVINLSGCDNVLEIFYTEEKTKQVTNDNKAVTNKSKTTVNKKTNINSSFTDEYETNITKLEYENVSDLDRSTTFTYIKKISDYSSKKSYTFSSDDSTCEHEPEIVNQMCYPSFLYTGYDSVTICKKCKKPIYVDYTNPYGKIFDSHYKYSENINNEIILSSFILYIDDEDANQSIYDENNQLDKTVRFAFNMIKNEYSETKGYKMLHYSGYLSVYENDIFVLRYDDNKRTNEYVIFREGEFYFTDSNGKYTDSNTIINKASADDYYPRVGNTDYGFYFLNNYENSSELKMLYYYIYELCEGLYNSDTDVLNVNGYYLLCKINLNRFNLSLKEGMGIANLFFNCSPVYYFLSTITGFSDGTLNILIDSRYSLYSARESVITSYTSALNQIDSRIKNGSSVTDKEKIKIINDFLCENLEYAWKDDEKTIPEDGAWAHSISGLLLYNKGVCECYSKWFLLLTQYYGIDSAIVTGIYDSNDDNLYDESCEGHSWNIVKLEDDWYGVDVTFNDQNYGIIYTYLCCSEEIIGENRIYNDYFVIDKEFQYAIPIISNKSITW